MKTRSAILSALLVAGASPAGPARASASPQSHSADAGALIRPVPPAVVTRGETGQVVVRAVRVTERLRIDGRLDEAIYQSVPAISDFIQAVPHEGEPATDKTEAWILFDGDAMYVAGRCWD